MKNVIPKLVTEFVSVSDYAIKHSIKRDTAYKRISAKNVVVKKFGKLTVIKDL